MFHLHDTTRRRICVAGFLSLGVLPALLISGWCLGRSMPGCAEAEADRIGRQLGLEVKIGGLRHLRPGAVLYEQLEAADPETSQVVFRCRLLEVARGEKTEGQCRTTLTMIASQPEVEAGGLRRIWRCLQRNLEGYQGPLETDVQVSAAELTLRATRHSQTLTEVRGSLENLPSGTHAQLLFRLAGADTPEPARIRLVRNLQVSPPASGFELYTGGGELPCNVLAMGLDALKPMGPRCRFRGYIWASEMPDGWQGEVTGQLVDLDMGRLVSDHFPHRLAGRGDVTIQSARFCRGRLEEGNAIVVAGPGTIDRALIDATVDRLGLVAGGKLLSVEDKKNVPYDELAFLATLDSQGLRLSGRCAASEPGVILSLDRRCLLGQSQQHQKPSPAVALVQTLVPQSAVQVPAGRQTDWLLRHLPLPEVMPIPGSRTAPHARIRLRDTWQR